MGLINFFGKEKAVRVSGGTLVGYIDSKPDEEIPIGGGNCFSVLTTRLRNINILNIGEEDLEKVMRLRNISFPLEMKILDKGYGIITDSRIPKNWFLKEYCRICTPGHLLPKLQIKRLEKQYKLKLEKGLIKVILPRKLEKNIEFYKSNKPELKNAEIVFHDIDDFSAFTIEKPFPKKSEDSNFIYGTLTELIADIQYPELYRETRSDHNEQPT
jgi:hypothetical protein